MNKARKLSTLPLDDNQRIFESLQLKSGKIVFDGVFDIGKMGCYADDFDTPFRCDLEYPRYFVR